MTNLFVNSRNRGYPASAWLAELDCRHVRQLHVVGYRRGGARVPRLLGVRTLLRLPSGRVREDFFFLALPVGRKAEKIGRL